MNDSNLFIDDILRKRALKTPQETAYRFLLDGESLEVSISYHDLDKKAQTVASALKHKLTKGPQTALALLLFPSGLEFISAFFGSLYAGVIAVPLSIPKANRTSDRLSSIFKESSFSLILSDQATYKELRRHPFFSSLPDDIWVLTDQLEGNFSFEKRDRQPIAFLQYTSGSTTLPKGVIITHDNIIANQKMIQEAFGHDASTVFVGWLPLFHDMGLVGNILQPMYLGIPSTLISPVAFLQKPIRWLRAISKYRATTSGAPNFAYDLCVQKIKDHEIHDLDLSCWKVAFNGAEPIHLKTLERFVSHFGSCGFRKNAFYPCYGMAEATVFISGNAPKQSWESIQVDRQALEQQHRALPSTSSQSLFFVSVGKSWQNEKISIVHPEKWVPCSPFEVGEIWVQGPHVGIGYWNQPEATTKAFHNRLASDEGFFLRTGDLGFLDQSGTLFITGRLKDLMIIRGRNIYPQDVEFLVEKSDPALRPHGSAAFSITQDEQECLIIVSEIEREHIRYFEPEIVRGNIRQTLSQELQIIPTSLVFIKPGTLPRTSSGKVQRTLCKKLFLENKLETLAQVKGGFSTQNPSVPIVAELKERVATTLHLLPQQIEPHTILSSYGLDSLGAIEIQAFLQERWSFPLGFEELLGEITLEQLTSRILAYTPSAATLSSSRATLSSLSYQQQGIWVDMKLFQNPPVYHLAKVVEITSPVNAFRLKESLAELAQRHELLRAQFSSQESSFKILPQISLPFFEIAIPEKDLTEFFQRTLLQPFQMDDEVLFAAWLIKTETDRHLLFLKAHHLIADLWSLGIFLEELIALYDQLQLPPIQFSYRDYINFQRESLLNAHHQQSIEFWKLHYAPSTLLTTDFPKQAVPTFEGGHLYFNLPNQLSHALKSFSHLHNTTPFVVLLSAYFVLLWERAGGKHWCVGTTSSYRPDHRLHSCFGLFANLLPICSSLSPYLSFEQHVHKVKKVILDSFHYQVPFYQLIEQLPQVREKGSSQLFQTMFVYQSVPTLSDEFQDLIIPTSSSTPSFQKGSLCFQPQSWLPPTSAFDLSLFMNESRGQFHGYFEYSSELFSASTLHSMKDQFLDILERSLQHPQAHLSALSKFPTPPIFSEFHLSLIDLFEAQARRSPDKLALVEQEKVLTYSGLDVLSNQFAKVLIKRGATPDSVIGVKMEHAIEVVITILAILKVGAAFLPIHPKTPDNRLKSIVNDSHCSHIVISPNALPLPFPCIPCADWENESKAPFRSLAEYDSIAYLIYTSGSTGQPKGVCVSHQSLVNYLFAIREVYTLKGSLHFPLYSPLSFDLTLTSLFFPLLFGHTIHIYEEQEEIGSTLFKIFNHPLITHVKLTPSHLKLLEHFEISCPHLSQLIVGGEQLPASLVLKTCDLFKHPLTVINEYGPTETTIGCISYIFTSPTSTTQLPILPIGTPLTNTWTYLFNDYLQFLPLNTIGELYLGGIDVSYGYWNQPDLTAEKFIPDVLVAGKRVYKSADLALQLDPSTYICLGRNDRQVKVRGFRIELQEIEECLLQHPDIRETVVLLHTKEEHSFICAYFTQKNQGIEIDLVDLRHFMSHHLPHYMAPSVLIPCLHIPINTNGKVDTKTLPDPEQWLLPEDGIILTSLQKQLRQIWGRVLVLQPDKISLSRSFFELGGDSIKAIQLVSLCRAENLLITTSDLFQNPTLVQLAYLLETQNSQNRLISSEEENEEPCPLTPIQRWFFTYFPSPTHHFNQSLLLKRSGGFNPEFISRSFRAICEQHDTLRMFFPNNNSSFVRPSVELSFRLLTFDLTLAPQWESEMQREMGSLQTQLDFTHGPLLILGLFDTPHESYLFITIHHLLIDGVSWKILLEDFDRSYRQQVDGLPIKLAAQTTSYASWARKSIQNQSPLLPAKSFPVAHQIRTQVTLTNQETAKLLQKKIPGILLTALYSAFAKLGHFSLQLHLEGHGREHERNGPDLSRTIGWFTTLNPVELKVESPLSLPHLIRSVKECLLLRFSPTTYPEICFNYLGEFSSREYASFTFSPILTGTIDPKASIPYSLQCNLFILDKQLHVEMIFDDEKYPNETRTPLLHHFRSDLLALIEYLNHETPEEIPTDFGLNLLAWEEWQLLRRHPQIIEKILPLSPMQEGLIYHIAKEPSSRAYHEQLILELTGKIKHDELQKCGEYLLETYESLRAAFFYQGLSSPKQVIFKQRPLLIHFSDLSEQSSSLDGYLREDKSRGFDIARDTLFRMALFDKGSDRSILVWSFHHLILDGWSLSNLFRAFLDHFQGLSAHGTSLSTYTDWLNQQDKKQATLYWTNLLQQFDSPVSLPKIVSTEPVCSAKSLVSFSSIQIENLHKLATKQSVTMNSLFQAIWCVLLNCFSQKSDLLFGTVISGRNPNIEGIEKMVGLFIQTIPLRIRLNDYRHFTELAQGIQKQLVQSEPNSFLSLSEIQSLTPLRNHLIDHLFVFENYPFSGQAHRLVEERQLPFHLVSAELIEETHYPLILSIIPDSPFTLEIQYHRNLFEEGMILALGNYFSLLIDKVCGNPLIPLDEISLISSSDRQLSNEIPYPKEKTLVDLFEEQAKRTPEKVAIVSGSHQLTYRLLDQRTDLLASYLAQLGIGLEKGVGILLPRSIEMVMAWLAVLKSGGFYIPLDPSYSHSRINSICEETHLQYILTTASLASTHGIQKQAICLDQVWEEIAKTTLIPCSKPDSSNLAYVLYTSGSTGKPKGIAMPHSAVGNHFHWFVRHFQVNPQDQMLQLTTFTFDVALCELYALFAGATLVLAPPEAQHHPEALLRVIEEERISIVQLVPSLLEVLLKTDDFTKLQSVRHLLCGADILKQTHLKQWFQKCSIPLTNLYGLSETCIDATFYPCSKESASQVIPIGKPLDNLEIFVCDEQGALLPPEISGELYVGGNSLARGYYLHPEWTAERFLPHPCKVGEILYRTGDLAVHKSDGQLYYLGRKDLQIKIRGFRIELEEIEKILSSYPDMERVIVRTVGEGSQRALCAYFSGASVHIQPLKIFLEERVPHYMVPSFFVKLDQFPLIAHGKIDITALPNPLHDHVKVDLVHPQNELQRQISLIWKEVLQLDLEKNLSIDYNFFDLGGNSMILMQMLYQLNKQLQRSLSFEKIFQYPTIRSLSEFLNSSEKEPLDFQNIAQRIHQQRLRRAKEKNNNLYGYTQEYHE